MVTGKIFDLAGLTVHNVGCVGHMLVNEVFVGHVDQGAKVDARDADEG